MGAVVPGGDGKRLTQAERGDAFAALHESDPFIIPNPWDAGSARVLQALGFNALATTSAGFAFTLGRRDGATTLDEVARHIEALSAVTDLPISVDLEHGFGPDPADAARAIARAADAGAVGGSIEDFDPVTGFYPREQAVERVVAAAESARSVGFRFTLTARVENYFRDNPDLDDTIARLQAYETAGADVLYAPGLTTVADIRTVCQSVGRPVNANAVPNLTFDELAGAGVQRVSLGGGLTWIAMNAMASAAGDMRDRGDFSALAVPTTMRGWAKRHTPTAGR